MNRLVALQEWVHPVTSLATGIISVLAVCYVPFTIYNELQVVKASSADVKASNAAVLATVMKLEGDMKVSNTEMRAAMQFGFAELKANQRRWI